MPLRLEQCNMCQVSDRCCRDRANGGTSDTLCVADVQCRGPDRGDAAPAYVPLTYREQTLAVKCHETYMQLSTTDVPSSSLSKLLVLRLIL